MNKPLINVLFLCTGNSARSILAEAVLDRRGTGKFKAFSAGSKPKGMVHPMTMETLQKSGFDTSLYRSKSWDEFSGKDALKMDFVFTVCDSAASEVCPVWPGQPLTAHWGIVDPDQPGLPVDERRRLFTKVFRELDHRIKIFTALPLDKLEKLSLQKQLDEIGRSFPDAG
jgi:protein-tyrosine-phosphatase